MSYKGRKRKFHREAGQRGVMMRALATSLIEHGKVRTTEARARELRQRVEKLVTRARVDSVANRRIIASRLGNHARATRKLFTDIAPKFKERPGGYTRLTKIPMSRGNGRTEAVIEFVS